MPITAYFSVAPTDASVLDKVVTVSVSGAAVHGSWYFEPSSQPVQEMEAYYRMATDWPAHSTVTVTMPVAGLWAGAGFVFADSLTLNMKIGASLVVKIDG